MPKLLTAPHHINTLVVLEHSRHDTDTIYPITHITFSPLLYHLLRRPPPQRIAQAVPIFSAIICAESELQAVELGHCDDAIETIFSDEGLLVVLVG
jgi:hypothetical protein